MLDPVLSPTAPTPAPPDPADDAAAGSPTDPLVPMSAAASVPDGDKKKKKDKDKEAAPAHDPNDPNAAIRELGSKRGVETLFRTSYRVNMDLTSLADAKANIMISINGLMISILIAQIASKVDANPWLYAPTSVFIVGCLVSIIFAILAARPRVQGRTITLEEVRRTKTNILFFGNFAHLTGDEFQTAMKERVTDPADLYTMMMDDIYGVGSVLQKKYRLLSASYLAFMIALVVGVLAFVIVFGYAAFFESGPTLYTPGPVAPTTGVPFIP